MVTNTNSQEGDRIRVAVDVAAWLVREAKLQLLLVRRGSAPYDGRLALPGVALQESEDLERAARRALREKAGVTDVTVEQVAAFGGLRRDPRNRVVAIAYTALVREEPLLLKALATDGAAAFHDYRALPKLAFDHDAIAAAAYQRLVAGVRRFELGREWIGERFTLSDLQGMHEAVLGERFDQSNFRKRALDVAPIVEAGEDVRRAGLGRPARVYRWLASEP